MSDHASQAFLGSFFHTPVYGEFEYLEDTLIEVDDAGVITRVVQADDREQPQLVARHREAGTLVELGEGYFGLPGFVDIHVHAAQWPQAALSLDAPLEVWLNDRTFPLESRYSDIDFARTVYTDLVQQLLARGTTTVMYQSSVDLESSIELARICDKQGQRAIVGKTVMDDPAANPDYYRDASTASAIAETEILIREVEQIGRSSRQGIWPVVTPRFIPSCTDEGLIGLGRLAAKYDTYIQTHCNEGQWEHDVVLERYGKTDPFALRDLGLLSGKAIMAHCPYLTREEGEMFAELGVGIAHCPVANSYFSSAIAPIRRFRSQGIHVGLGTDVSGGYSPSMYEVMRQAVICSRLLETGVDAQVPPDSRGLGEARLGVAEVFWMATAGGAQTLHLPVAVFEPGRAFDLQVVDTRRRDSNLTGFGVFDEPADKLARMVYLTTPDNVRQVWVQGRLVRDKNAE